MSQPTEQPIKLPNPTMPPSMLDIEQPDGYSDDSSDDSWSDDWSEDISDDSEDVEPLFEELALD